MSRTVWFNCCAGVAGDMLLAALVDAGGDRAAVADAWGALGVGGYEVDWREVRRCGVRATHVQITADRETGHRPVREVLDTIGSAGLEPRVQERAMAVYDTLAQVEGAIHGVDPSDVVVHEVGALDSILDVVGVSAALESLGVDRVAHSPIAVGHGTVDTAHGRLPNPVPAVTALLARYRMPTVGLDTTMELSTPTGVALLGVLGEHRGEIPALNVVASGFGAGTADPDSRPNVVQAVVGTTATGFVPGSAGGRPARVVEANVDDVTGEVLAHTIVALLAAGAHDAWATPIVMKKGRPAHTVHALCDDATVAEVSAALIAETGSLGLRGFAVERWPQRRSDGVVDVDGHRIRVKVSGGRVKVEHDDAAAAARSLGRPLRAVLAAAEHEYVRRAERP